METKSTADTVTNDDNVKNTTDNASLITALSYLKLSQTQQVSCPVVNFTNDDHSDNETAATHDDDESTVMIQDVSTLSLRLVDMANAIFKTLGSQQMEATYQRCLALDLENAGLVVEQEVELALLYKQKVVGTRRADLLVTFPTSNKRAVLELKAVSTLAPSHARQLQYYMYHFGIDTGYLVNFPHDDGFPSTEEAVFQLTTLSSTPDAASLDTPILRLRKDPKDTSVQVIEFKRLEGDEANEEVERKKAARLDQTTKVWGITSTGLPCKFCQEEEAYCRYHKDQQPRQEATEATIL